MTRFHAFFILFFLTSPVIVQSQTVDASAVDGHLHIKLVESSVLDLDGYTGGVLALDLLMVPYGIDTIYKPFKLPGHALDQVYRVRFTAIQLMDALITALEALTFVEFAEKMPLGLPAFEPNDLAPQQWYLPQVNASEAWDLERGDPNVVIAIVDNGVALDHADLSANIFTNMAEANGLPLIDDDMNGFADDVNGYDTADRNANPRPPSSGNNDNPWPHGTHVAGIAAAVTDNGTGMAGMAHGCRILPVKVAKNSGNGQQFETPIDGVFYASRTGAEVINMSWGTNLNSQVMYLVIQEAHTNGAVLVAAAGNDGNDELFYPAAFPEVISVGATDANDLRAPFSNYGSTIDVMAPGVNIYSALLNGNNSYGNLSGTSMAAPLVAGLAALVKSRFPSLSPAQVKQRIVDGCMNIDQLNAGFGGQLGAGRINALASLAVTSVLDAEQDGAIALYPNPANVGETIRFIGFSTGAVSLEMTDMTGRTVVSEIVTDGRFQLPISVPCGMYAVRISGETGTSVMRLLVR